MPGTTIFSYLSVVAGIISEADYVFLPESPPQADWPDRLVLKLEQASPKRKSVECRRLISHISVSMAAVLCRSIPISSKIPSPFWLIFCNIYFCSYLALVGGLACEADFIFIPEMPPKVDWPDRLCSQLAQARCSSISIPSALREVAKHRKYVLDSLHRILGYYSY